MRPGALTTLVDLENCELANQKLKRLGTVYQEVCKVVEKLFHQIGQGGSHVFIRLLREFFENLRSSMNRR